MRVMRGFRSGLLTTDLSDLLKKAVRRDKFMEKTRENLKSKLDSLLSEITAETGEKAFYYDEWDYLINDYRVKWCRLREKEIQEKEPGFVPKTIKENAELVKEVRKQFQMLKPERFKGFPFGAGGGDRSQRGHRGCGGPPGWQISLGKNLRGEKPERPDFSTLFLVDVSASTDEKTNGKEKKEPPNPPTCDQKVIDIEKEALVVMARPWMSWETNTPFSVFRGTEGKKWISLPSRISR